LSTFQSILGREGHDVERRADPDPQVRESVKYRRPISIATLATPQYGPEIGMKTEQTSLYLRGMHGDLAGQPIRWVGWCGPRLRFRAPFMT
jgi:hypothetical protein